MAAPPTECKGTQSLENSLTKSVKDFERKGMLGTAHILQAVIDTEKKTNVEKTAKFDKYSVRFGMTFEEIDYLGTASDNIGIFPRRNIVVNSGKMKNGKTKFLVGGMAGVIGGSWGVIKATHSNTKGIFYDCEMDKSDTFEILRGISALCGWTDNNDRLRVFNLRELNYDERKTFIQESVEYYHPDIITIDTVTDLCPDYNDLALATNLVNWLAAMASTQNVCIVCVIHENRGNSETQGHLGHVLDRKMFNKFSVEKTGAGFLAKDIVNRRQSCKPINFLLDNDGVPRPKTTDIQDESENKQLEEIKRILPQIFDGHPNGVSYSWFIARYNKLADVKDTTSYRRLNLAMAHDLVKQVGDNYQLSQLSK